MIDKNVNLLVVSAHAADFVWRAGGTIAKYVKHGANHGQGKEDPAK